MNKERLLEMAEKLETSLPEGFVFNMEVWLVHGPDDSYEVETGQHLPECSTAGCIAGLACLLYIADPDVYYDGSAAQIALDLTDDEASELFTPVLVDEYGNDSWGWITNKIAAQALRNFAEKGDPGWVDLWRGVSNGESGEGE